MVDLIVIIGVVGFILVPSVLLAVWFTPRESGAYEYEPRTGPSIPSVFEPVLHYPAEPEPEPEESPLAAINRYWNYNGTRDRYRERPGKMPKPEVERPVKLPRFHKAYELEPESPVEKRPPWDIECAADERLREKLEGYGWATVEQREWVTELLRWLQSRGYVRCGAAAVLWNEPGYQRVFGPPVELAWNATRTEMSMYDFAEMLDWERQYGAGNKDNDWMREYEPK